MNLTEYRLAIRRATNRFNEQVNEANASMAKAHGQFEDEMASIEQEFHADPMEPKAAEAEVNYYAGGGGSGSVHEPQMRLRP